MGTVQWPHLLKLYPRAEYAGRLYCTDDKQLAEGAPPTSKLAPLSVSTSSTKAVAIVTVGSTKFDALVAAVDSLDFLAVLRELGIAKLKVQKGNGACPSVLGVSQDTGIEVEVIDYTPNFAAELREAA